MLARAQGLHLGKAGRDRGRAVLGDAAKIGQALLKAQAEECVLRRQEDTQDSGGDAGIMEKLGGWGPGPRQES